MKNVLVISAHPDDEVLGVGGTINKHVNEKDNVFVLFITDGASNVYPEEKVNKLKESAKKCAKELGIKKTFYADLPNQLLDELPLLKIAQTIEKVIEEVKPSIIYTHSRMDTNQDHRVVFEATLIAARPLPESSVKRILSYETLSSTEWRVLPNQMFTPNYFVDISKYIDKKIKAFSCYTTEAKDFPHPRSAKGIRSLAEYRGISIGVEAAEAFVLIRELVK